MISAEYLEFKKWRELDREPQGAPTFKKEKSTQNETEKQWLGK